MFSNTDTLTHRTTWFSFNHLLDYRHSITHTECIYTVYIMIYTVYIMYICSVYNEQHTQMFTLVLLYRTLQRYFSKPRFGSCLLLSVLWKLNIFFPCFTKWKLYLSIKHQKRWDDWSRQSLDLLMRHLGFLPAVSVVPEPGVLSQNMIFSELPNQSVVTASSQLKIENWT